MAGAKALVVRHGMVQPFAWISCCDIRNREEQQRCLVTGFPVLRPLNHLRHASKGEAMTQMGQSCRLRIGAGTGSIRCRETGLQSRWGDNAGRTNIL